VQGRKEGGLRGGAVQLQVEAAPWVRLREIVGGGARTRGEAAGAAF